MIGTYILLIYTKKQDLKKIIKRNIKEYKVSIDLRKTFGDFYEDNEELKGELTKILYGRIDNEPLTYLFDTSGGYFKAEFNPNVYEKWINGEDVKIGLPKQEEEHK